MKNKYINNYQWKKILLFLPSFLFIFLIFLLPLFALAATSLIGVHFGDAYKFLFQNSDFIKLFFHSIIIGVFASFASLILGYPIAYWIHSFDNKFSKKAMIAFIILPLLLNSLIKVLILRSLLAPLSLLGSNFAIVIGLVFLYLPFMIICIYNSLQNIDNEIINSSYDLGASKFQTFKRIILPLSYPGIISGLLLVFLPSITTIIIPQFLGNNENNNIGSYIITLFSSGNFSYIAAASFITIIFIGILIFILKMLKSLRYRKKS